MTTTAICGSLMGANPANEPKYLVFEYAPVLGSTLRSTGLSGRSYSPRGALEAGAVQDHSLEHLAHLGGSDRRDYACAFSRLEGDGLRRVLRGDLPGDDAWGNADAVIGDG